MVPGGVEGLLRLHDSQLRGRTSGDSPIGAVVEQDGLLIRTHYGTHGTVDYRRLPDDGLDELVIRQRDAFAVRGERGEWKIYGHDTPAGLPGRLIAAGFTRGWERAVLVASLDSALVPPTSSLREAYDRADLERVACLATRAGPQRTAFAEFLADERPWSRDAYVLVPASGVPIGAAVWANNVSGTDFVVIEGIADDNLRLAHHLAVWDWQRSGRPAWVRRPDARYLLAEADGRLRITLQESGFQIITTATSYHWLPPNPPVATRPVSMLFDDPEYETLWDRFNTEFDFRPSTVTVPGITEPHSSATWHLQALDTSDEIVGNELQTIIERGLRACVSAEEPLYWLDWQHPGYRFDPQRVGGDGQPPWPGGVYPDGDYYLYLTSDLRLGTFGHPWEHTLCVFGTDLLARVEDRLNDLLGPVVRRGGSNI